MHLFDPGDVTSASRTPFIITFVAVSIGTYVIAASALWLVRYRKGIKSQFRGSGKTGTKKEFLRQRFIDLLPRMKPSDSDTTV
jgi:hypothetical protein